MKPDKQELIEYLYLLKTMDSQHKKLFGKDKDFEVPQLFSQEMVKQLLCLKDYSGEGKLFDAEKDGNYYEIKATSSDSGTTTLDFRNKAHVLVWIKFDFEKCEFEIKQLPNFNSMNQMENFYTKEAIKNRRKNAKNLFESKKRETVVLSNIKWEVSKKYKVQSNFIYIENETK